MSTNFDDFKSMKDAEPVSDINHLIKEEPLSAQEKIVVKIGA